MPTFHKYRFGLLGVSGLGLTLMGCMAPFATAPVTVAAPQRSTMAATVLSGQVDLFGDIRALGESRYQTRSAVSLKRHTFSEIGGDFHPDIGRLGEWMVFASTRHSVRADLYYKSIDGVAVTQLTSDPGSDIQPVFSPDGSQVAFASDRSGNWDIWVISLEGGQPVQITDGLSDELHPSWSPDGQRLVYCSMPVRSGQWELWITEVGTRSMKKFIGYGLFPEWSPHEEKILFQRARERGSRQFSVWTVSLVDGEPHYPTELASSAHHALVLPTWSADGMFVVMAATSNTVATGFDRATGRETFDLWMVDAAGGGRVRLTDGHSANTSPVFAPDGRIFFAANRDGHENIWSLQPTPRALNGRSPLTNRRGTTPVPQPQAAFLTPQEARVDDGL